MNEVWLPVDGFEGLYSISNFGRVMSHPRTVIGANGPYTHQGRVMRPAAGVSKYLTVRLTSSARNAKTLYVHALVLTAFVGARPAGLEACHGDGNRQNNRIDNLRWDTRSGNHADKRQHGTGTVGARHPMAKLNDAAVRALRARYAQGASIINLADEFGVAKATAYRAAHGQSWSHIA